MQPDAALGVTAQIAVALAGFAGVVTAFRSQSVHAWEPVDKLRLRLLLTNSIVPLALSLVALTFLAIEPVPPQIWRWCSVLLLAISSLFFKGITKQFRSLSEAELQSGHVNTAFSSVFAGLSIFSLLLQLYNIVLLNAFWPFFAGIVVFLLAAMFQFMRMILRSPTDKR